MTTQIIEAKDLKKWFPVRKGFMSTLFSRKSLFLHAVDGVSFHVNRNEIFGLVGESGSGKTTTGRLLLRLIEPTSGKIMFEGTDLTELSETQMKAFRRKMQIVFQDPYESLNPRMTVDSIVSEPLRLLHLEPQEDALLKRVRNVLEAVELIPAEEFMFRFPHELSGGQRQRVGVARALVVNPTFIVADEPVSMLDVSIRAEILNLMYDLVGKFHTSFLYITHDLALARHICDRFAVMYLGKIMEMSDTEKIIYEPLNPYTEALIEAVPVPDPDAKRGARVIKGEIPSPVNPPSGCRFHTRCPRYIGDICRTKEPELVDVGGGHMVACHLHSESK